ncbi:hypothetical protein IYC_19415 [Clostridium sporogenes PA 3679]|nr:hypothetical protein IYC_19415 [Clostridium sporogenes PA 3679]
MMKKEGVLLNKQILSILILDMYLKRRAINV